MFGEVLQLTRLAAWCLYLGGCWLCACETVGCQGGVGVGWLSVDVLGLCVCRCVQQSSAVVEAVSIYAGHLYVFEVLEESGGLESCWGAVW